MRLLGFEITRAKAALPSGLSTVDSNRGWWPIIRESFTGAWQRNVTVTLDTALANPTLFRCISLISSDVAKMRLRLVAQDADGIWTETDSASFSPVLRKPNRYQNRIQFFANWLQSKLTFGNTYVLKVRDNRNVVAGLYILDPNRVKPLVAPDGSVYYQLSRDPLSGLTVDNPGIPASEIIHDRWNCHFHPLVGLSPIFACGLAALQGNEIQANSTRFFQNGSKPGGVLTAPGAISQDTAERLKAHWEENFTGENVGKVAVLGDGLKYEAMAVNATDAQLIEQLKWTAEIICGCFGVPAYMAGVGAAPLNNNVQSLAELYYAQALQIHIESVELCLDEGLDLPRPYGTEFDLDDLLRMDTASQVTAIKNAVDASVMAPNEGRKKLNLKPVKGGESPMAQQQQFSLAALAERDRDKPFAKPDPAAPAVVADTPAPANDDAEAAAKFWAVRQSFKKGLAHVRR